MEEQARKTQTITAADWWDRVVISTGLFTSLIVASTGMDVRSSKSSWLHCLGKGGGEAAKQEEKMRNASIKNE
jgi:hypothetical protein